MSKKKATRRTAGARKKTAPAAARKRKRAVARRQPPAEVAADDPNYPAYVLTFRGGGAFDPPQLRVRGPHTAMLVATQTGVQLRVQVSHNNTVPPEPNLTITLTPDQS